MNDEITESQKDDNPSPQQAATVAGMQFVVAIAVALAVVIPGAIVVFVLLPMGWDAIGPLFVLAICLGCLAQVMRIVFRARSSSSNDE